MELVWPAFRALFGLALILMGVRLYATFRPVMYGLLGGMAGVAIARYLSIRPTEQTALVLAVVAVLSALGAYYSYTLDIARRVLMGIVVGALSGVAAAALLETWNIVSLQHWLAGLIGAAVGGLMQFGAGDVGLIPMTSFAGTVMLLNAVESSLPWLWRWINVTWILLTLVVLVTLSGIIVQYRMAWPPVKARQDAERAAREARKVGAGSDEPGSEGAKPQPS